MGTTGPWRYPLDSGGSQQAQAGRWSSNAATTSAVMRKDLCHCFRLSQAIIHLGQNRLVGQAAILGALRLRGIRLRAGDWTGTSGIQSKPRGTTKTMDCFDPSRSALSTQSGISGDTCLTSPATSKCLTGDVGDWTRNFLHAPSPMSCLNQLDWSSDYDQCHPFPQDVFFLLPLEYL